MEHKNDGRRERIRDFGPGFRLPDGAFAEFDFVYDLMAPVNAKSMDMSDWHALFKKLVYPEKAMHVMLNMLRRHLRSQPGKDALWLSVPQVRSLLDVQAGDRARVEVLVACFGRILDREYLQHLIQDMNTGVRRNLMKRLGCFNLFDPLS